MEYVVRFIAGGLAVSAFAILGAVFRPKSFAGLFGAAPSIALATLGIAIVQHGRGYAAVEARSMILGAMALGVYSVGCCRLLAKHKMSALSATGCMMVVWLICALGLQWPLLGPG